MSFDQILADLKNAATTEAKAALVAEAVISDMPVEISDAARRCGLLPWFRLDTLESLLKDKPPEFAKEAFITITDLPFVERIGEDYTFHASTRKGLLEKYARQQPEEIIAAFGAILPTLLEHWENDELAVIAIYALIVTSQTRKAQEYFDRFVDRINKSGKVKELIRLVEYIEEAQQLPLPDDLGLSSKQWKIIAEIHWMSNQLTKSLSDYDRVIRMDPQNSETYSNRGLIFGQQKDFDNAFRSHDIAIRLNPNNTDSYLRRGYSYLLNEELNHAIADFTRAISLDPQNAIALILRGNAFEKKDRKEKALADFNKAAVIDSQNSNLLLTRGGLYMSKKDYDRAISDFTKLIEISPTSNAFNLRATAYRMKNDYSKAIEDYDKAIELDFENEGAYYGRGKSYLESGQIERSISDLEHTIELENDDTFAYLRLFEAYQRLGDYEKAERFLQKTIDLTSKERDEKELQQLLFASRELRRFDLALAISLHLLEINQEDPDAENSAGYCYNQLGEFDKAKSHLERAIRIGSDQIYPKLNLGISFWRLHKSDAARSLFKQALQMIIDKKVQKKYMQGWLQVMTGNSISGIAKIRRFMDDDPDKDDMYNLLDWSNVILAGDERPPDGIEAIREIVSAALSR